MLKSKNTTALNPSDFLTGNTFIFILLITLVYVIFAFTARNSLNPFGVGLLFKAGLLGLGSIYLFALGVKTLRKKQLIEDIPTSKIRSLAMGLTELSGKAGRLYSLVSPLTKTPCVYFLYTVEIKVRTGKGSSHWKEVSCVCSGLPFSLHDETGKVSVDPNCVELNFAPRREMIDGSGRRHREWFILDAEPVYLIGTAKKNKDFLSDRKLLLNEEIRRLKNNKEKLLRFDINNNGVLDVEEWDAAVLQLEGEFLRKEAAGTGTDPLADISIAKGDLEDIFIISETSEKSLLKTLSWRGAALVAGSLLTAGFLLAATANKNILLVLNF